MRHFFNNIQGWSSFVFLYQEEVEKADDGAIFVEIGAWKGKSTAYMAVEIINSGKDIEFWTIDTFKGSDEPKHHEDPVIQEGRLEEEFRRNIRDVNKYVNVHVGDSSEHAAAFEDEIVDFIFIDGAHTFEGVTKDLEAWWPKLKPGSRMGGDDIRWAQVYRAVTTFFGCKPTITENGKHWWMVKSCSE